jgi:hypothetical protein
MPGFKGQHVLYLLKIMNGPQVLGFEGKVLKDSMSFMHVLYACPLFI